MKRAIIFSAGGVIQTTAADPGVKIALVDYDERGEDPTWTAEFGDPDGEIESITDPEVLDIVPELKEPEFDSVVPAGDDVRVEPAFEYGGIVLVFPERAVSFDRFNPKRTFLRVNAVTDDHGKAESIGFNVESMSDDLTYFELSLSEVEEFAKGLLELAGRARKGEYDDGDS